MKIKLSVIQDLPLKKMKRNKAVSKEIAHKNQSLYKILNMLSDYQSLFRIEWTI